MNSKAQAVVYYKKHVEEQSRHVQLQAQLQSWQHSRKPAAARQALLPNGKYHHRHHFAKPKQRCHTATGMMMQHQITSKAPSQFDRCNNEGRTLINI